MNKKIISKIAIGALAPVIAFSSAVTLFAEERPEVMPVGLPREKVNLLDKKARVTENLEKKQEMMDKAEERGIESIEKRIADLNQLKTKISGMKNVSDSEKSKILASIDDQIAKLNELKTKISSSTDATTLKENISSITKDNRIYMNFEPKMKILAAGERIKTLVEMMNSLVPKLESRMEKAKTAGKDMTAMNKAFEEIKLKISVATDLASKINTSVSAINPDGGNADVLKANMAILKEARTNLKLANDALKDANKNVRIITQGVREKGVNNKTELDNRINKGDAPSGTGTTSNSSAQ